MYSDKEIDEATEFACQLFLKYPEMTIQEMLAVVLRYLEVMYGTPTENSERPIGVIYAKR